LLAVVIAALGCSTGSPQFHRDILIEQQRTGFWKDGNPDFTDRQERLSPTEYANVMNLLETERPMLALYREDVTHEAVGEFFIQEAGSKKVALPMLYHAERNDLPLSLVFALVWVESQYNTRAVHYNRGGHSVDKGLFQLNSRTFRSLSDDDFFSPDISARHGTAYLSYAFDAGGDAETAVAIYNAGPGRVLRGQVPDSTERYRRRILAYRDQLDARFRSFIRHRFPAPQL